MLEEKPRRSRMRRQDSGRRIALTLRDIEIFRLLTRYRYLRSTFIHAFVGGDRTKLIERLGALYHDGGFIDRPREQWQTAEANHEPIVYELATRGADALARLEPAEDSVTWLGHGGGKRQYHHALMICGILASIELGLRAGKNLRLITWRDILRHPRCPEAAHAMSKPFAFPLGNGRPESTTADAIMPDAVFGIEYAEPDRRSYRFFALEADRGSMPVTRTKRGQSCYVSKLHGYCDVVRRQLYRTHVGLPNLFVLTVTTSEARKETMLRAAKELCGDANIFLFKAVVSNPNTGSLRYPFPELVSQPWDRGGQPPLAIDCP